VTRRVALVTGAGRGIGLHVAVALARRGFHVVATHRGAGANAEAVLAAVRAVGGSATALPLDLRRLEDFPGFVGGLRAVLADAGAERLEVLVNNAGIGVFGPIEEVGVEDFDAVIATNLRGPFFLLQALLPLLGRGSAVLDVTTSLTRHSSPATSVYTASKAALEALTRSLATELGPRGIRILSVAPGPSATDFNGGAMRDEPAFREGLAAATALRDVGDPARVAAAIAALADTDFDWVTGERIEVSGGAFL